VNGRCGLSGNQTRARFLADGGVCEMRELGELPCDECAAEKFHTGNRSIFHFTRVT
jgi:hypothetical protein